MKIINEKGKLFGIINIIDLSVLLIVGLLIVGGTKRMKAKPNIGSETTPGIVTFQVSNVRIPTVENIVVGDLIYHYDKGGLVGKIIEVDYEPYQEPVEFEGKWVNADVPEKYVVNFKVEANIKHNPDMISVGGEQSRIGAQFRLKNKKVAFFGTVLGIEIK